MIDCVCKLNISHTKTKEKRVANIASVFRYNSSSKSDW